MHKHPLFRGWMVLCLIFNLMWVTSSLANEPTPQQLEFFENKIRPLFAASCKRCHSAETRQRGGLSLDSRATLLEGGDSGPAIVPGTPEKSRLIKAIGYTDPNLRMPPKNKLAKEQINDLTAWVKMGAPWPDTEKVAKKVNIKEFNLEERRKHWAFQPMKRPELPSVKYKDWPLSPIDHFILRKLENAGLKPNPPANPRILIRRVYFDLIGLPPTPKEIDQFEEAAKQNPQAALDKLVDRLLQSPHYGERWARHWLDLVRFAETYGHEFDFNMPDPWRYRDYVIRAFNQHVPYDQFVREHIAGDILPQPRRHPKQNFNESILATGFWFLGEAKHSPVDVCSDQADRLDNQIDVFGKTFLGLTLACARCHDHKFDPIPQTDYYALMGYLESSRFQRAFFEDPEPFRKRVRKLQDIRRKLADLAIPITAANLKDQLTHLPDFLVNPQEDPQITRRLDQLKNKAANDITHPLHPWMILGDSRLNPDQFAARKKDLLNRLKSNGKNSENYEVFADFDDGDFDDWFVTGEAFGKSPSGLGSLLFQPDQKRPVQGIINPGIAHSGLVSSKLQGVIRSPSFTITKPRIFFRVQGRQMRVRLILNGLELIRNPIYGGLNINVNHGEQPRWVSMDVHMWKGHRAYIEVLDDGPGYAALDQVVFADVNRPPSEQPDPQIIQLLENPKVGSPQKLAVQYKMLFSALVDDWRAGKLAKSPDKGMLLSWLLADPFVNSLPGKLPGGIQQVQAIYNLIREHQKVESTIPIPARAMAMADGTPHNEKLFIRGSHKNLGKVVPRRFLQVFVDDANPPQDRSGRLELAKRMLEPDNPLTTRVMVNRIWQHHFADGIVKSVDNFGVLGEVPSHPELLDWLATEFIRRKWSIQEMHKLMILSRTYQMSSRPQKMAKDIDPTNKLLHRMPVRRLEGEIIRDSLLAISGRLDKTLYGPGVMPHLTPFMSGRGRPPGSGPLDGKGRRSIYINVRRNFLTPFFLVFDYPVPFSTMGRRNRSNVPAQALAMMNDPFVLQQTQVWSEKIAESQMATEKKIDLMFQTALGRHPSERELEQMQTFLRDQQKRYGNDNDPRRVWHDLAHVIVNLKEFIYLN